MTDKQLAALRRLTNALDHRYMQLNGELCDAIDLLEQVIDTLGEGHPVGNDVHLALSKLVAAANEGSTLQHTVADVLRQQLAQGRSAKTAYSQGWNARLLDLLARATPEQAEVIRAVLIESSALDDDGIPF